MKKKPLMRARNDVGFKRKYLIMTAILLLVGITQAWALDTNSQVGKDEKTSQQTEHEVTGKVIDDTGKPIPGVNVYEKSNPQNGVITDIDGSYTIKVGSDATLNYSFIGFKDQQVNVARQNIINIKLISETTGLNEVVITALGIRKETKALGYAISEVKGDAVTAAKDVNVMSSLSGRMAGVDISTSSAGPSGSTRMLIRGNSQLSGGNNPLYVIDGVPMENSQLGSAGKWGGYDFGDGLSSINPDDIESISVLKGPSAAALYGSRASNGVVLITTKSGDTKKGIGVEFSTSVNAVNLLSKFDDYQTTYGQGRNGELPLTSQESRNSATTSWGPKLDPNLTMPIYNGDVKPYGVQEDNILSFFRTGLTINNSASLTASNEKSNIRLSMSNMQNTDIIPESDMSKTSFMLKGGAQLSRLVSFDARVNYTLEDVHNRPALSASPNNVGLSLIGIAPNFHQSWLGENYKDDVGNYQDWNGGNIYRINPYWSLNDMSNDSRKQRVMGHVQLKFDFTSYLSMHVKGGTDFYQFRLTEFSPIGTPISPGGQMREMNVNNSETNAETMLRFNKRFNNILDVSAFVGANIMYRKGETFTNVGKTQVIPNMESIGNYIQKELSYGFNEKQVNSVYGAVNLGYNSMAYLDFTLRNDWSSTLSSDYNSYMYPSVSGSFVFSELIEDNSILSFGKVRASWAEVGGDTDPYQLSLNYGLEPFSFMDLPLGQIQSSTIPKQDLKPTRTLSWEIGTDMRFLNYRMGLDVAYYDQTTKDQILSLPISKTTGYNTAVVNAGEITNKGIEVSLSATLVKSPDFNWDVNVNFARNVNEVVSLHPDVSEYELSAARWAGAFVKASEGEAYGVIVGKKMLRDPNGNVIHNAESGLPTFGDKAEVLGNGVHDWTGGLSSTMRYKGLTLGCLFDVKWGAEIYSMSKLASYANGSSNNTLEGRDGWYVSEEQRKAAGVDVASWTPTGGYIGKGVINTGTAEEPVYVENDVMVNPQTYWGSFYDGSPEPFIEDASFIKLREVTLAYSFNEELLKKTPFVNASLSVYGRNLWLIYSSLDNIDPESNYNNGNGQGLEYGSLPSRRTYGVSLNLKF